MSSAAVVIGALRVNDNIVTILNLLHQNIHGDCDHSDELMFSAGSSLEYKQFY